MTFEFIYLEQVYIEAVFCMPYTESGLNECILAELFSRILTGAKHQLDRSISRQRNISCILHLPT
jgi:hypothetical protein